MNRIAAVAILCVAGCAGEDAVSTDVPVATSIEAVSGGGRIAPYGTTLADPLIVKVKDQFGNGMAGVLVTFTVSGTVILDRYTMPTTSSGRAQVIFGYGNRAGVDTVIATAAGVSSSAMFIETSNPGIAAILSVASGNNQSSTAGSQLPADFIIQVTDVVGNPTPFADIVWTSVKGTPTFTKNATGADGKAKLRFTPGAGTNTINVSVDKTSLLTAFTATGN